MSNIPPEIIERAKAVDILAVARNSGAILKHIAAGEFVGPCIRCGGRDRFSISTRKNVFFCRGCNAKGDVIALVQFINGVSFARAVELLALGGGRALDAPRRTHTAKVVLASDLAKNEREEATREHARQTDDDTTRLRPALTIFDGAQDPHGTEVEVYLAARKLELPFGADAIRFHPRCPFGRERVPCMVALFRDNLTDEPVGIQRTRLPPSGWAPGMKMERLNLGPTSRGSIKIDGDADVLHGVVLAEGAESTLALRMLGYRPAWATGGKGTIRNFPVLPEPVQSLSIHFEPDAADDVRACIDRWRDAGREVIILKSLFGKDAADALWEAS